MIPFFVSNLREGETYGVELAADWWVSDWWRLQAAYSYLEMRLRTQAGGEDPGQDGFEGRSPMHQVSLRSSMDLGAGLELDLWARYVDDLPGQNLADYLTVDARLGWKPHSRFEVALVGQNLFSKQHPEFSYTDVIDTLPTEVERSVYGEVTWRF